MNSTTEAVASKRAWRRFVQMGRQELPAPLRDTVELVVELARAGGER